MAGLLLLARVLVVASEHGQGRTVPPLAAWMLAKTEESCGFRVPGFDHPYWQHRQQEKAAEPEVNSLTTGLLSK
jgi:hypothetical protein